MKSTPTVATLDQYNKTRNKEKPSEGTFEIHEQDAFLKKHKSRFQKNAKDIEAKKQSIGSILNTLNDAPTKLHIANFATQSVKPAKKGENPLHGGDGSAIQK